MVRPEAWVSGVDCGIGSAPRLRGRGRRLGAGRNASSPTEARDSPRWPIGSQPDAEEPPRRTFRRRDDAAPPSGSPMPWNSLQFESGPCHGVLMVFWLSLACLAVLPSQVQAQQAPDGQEELDRFVLEAGIVGGSSGCPGHYVGINGEVAGPVSLYGMVENFRCADRAGSASRFGASVLVGRSSWLVRPALRAGIETSTNYVGVSGGASLTFGRRYGARFILHFEECGSTACERFQMGGYVSF